ncbi:unnamed protein product, partial [Cyprideis torosa]
MHPSVRKCYRICLPKEKLFFECPEEDPALPSIIIGFSDTKHQSTSILLSVNMFRAVLSVFLSALLIQQGAATHTELTAFEDVVSGLLLGQHLNLVFNSEECGVDVGGDFVRAITSIPIKFWRWVELEPGVTRVSFTHTFVAPFSDEYSYDNFQVAIWSNDGQPFEHIEFVDQEYLKADQMDLFALTTSLYPSGEIVVRSEVWNLDNWDVDMEGLLTCQYDDVMTFTLEPEEDEVEYTSYDEMVEGLLSGHELEVVFDTFDCVKIPGEAPGPHRIYVENIQQWQLGATGTGQTFVRFSTYHFRNDADPVLEFEEFDIFSDGNMFMATMQMDLSTGNVNFRDNYLCQLGTDARVFGFLGDTTRVTDFSELTEAVEMGYHMTTVIDYNQCNSTIVGDTALYLGMSFYELFETLDTSNATEVLTEHRGMVNLGLSDPQYSFYSLQRLVPYLRNQSEDCLYLNIYAPVTGNRRNLMSVVVFIHGESFDWGTGNVYDGRTLAGYGQIVVVTFNYRLGALGYLRPNAAGGSVANFALLDQIAALNWIKENIEQF